MISALDLTRHAFLIPKGELVLLGTWLHWEGLAGQNESEPALVIVPRYRKSGFKPAVVALSAAFKYSSPEYCAWASKEFAMNLGMDSASTAHLIGELIHSHLDDLLKMPNSPTETIVVGEARIHDGVLGGKTVEIVDHDVMKQH